MNSVLHLLVLKIFSFTTPLFAKVGRQKTGEKVPVFIELLSFRGKVMGKWGEGRE